MSSLWKNWTLASNPANGTHGLSDLNVAKTPGFSWRILLGASIGVAGAISTYVLLNRQRKLVKRRKSKGVILSKGEGTRDILVSTAELPCHALFSTEMPFWLTDLEKEFQITTERLESMSQVFIQEMTKGLAFDGRSLKMLPAYITRLPTGNEQGRYLAMDVGGTNLRVIEVTLEGNRKLHQKHKKFTIDDAMKTSTGTQLFDFFATCVADFLVSTYGNSRGKYTMGFTFSFPTEQIRIDSGKLIAWTKGFSCSDVVGHDVVDLLQQAFKRKNLSIRVVALANDTVGSMMSQAYIDPQCRLGVIIGTGTNAAYMECMQAVTKLKKERISTDANVKTAAAIKSDVRGGSTNSHPTKNGTQNATSEEDTYMAINMEWGDFDKEKRILPFTMYDDTLDKATRNVGRQRFEKIISGLYLGEIARLILLDLAKKQWLFQGYISYPLETIDSLTTVDMSLIEMDVTDHLQDIDKFLKKTMHIEHSTYFDRQVVQLVCEWVSTRAARLSAMAICSVLLKINALNGKEKTTVAMDGAVFEQYPYFAQRMRATFRELVGMLADQIHLVLSKDGSGLGAALCAAMV